MLLYTCYAATNDVKMSKGSKHKKSFFSRLIELTVKPPPKAPTRKFSYQLPTSFFKAVDRARLAAGDDILPRIHHPSVSPITHEEIASASFVHHRVKRKNHATSKHHERSPKKVRFRVQSQPRRSSL